MAVTGENWKTFRLLDLIKGIEPDDIASYVETKSDDYDKKLSKLSEFSKKLDSLAVTIKNASTELDNVRKEVGTLINSALESGVYFHVVGIDGRLNTNNAFVDRAEQHLLEDVDDPNRPNFVGESSRVGGGLILIGANSPAALRQSFIKLGSIFPVIFDIIGVKRGAIALPGQSILDTSKESLDAWNNLKNTTGAFGSALSSLWSTDGISMSDLFDGASVVENTDPNKWYAQRLTDLIPMLDPNEEGSVGNMLGDILDTADSFAMGLSSSANSIAIGIQSLQSQITTSQSILTKLKKQLSGLINDAAQTGIYLHWLGRDSSLKNNRDFATAIRRCFDDRLDENRPDFQGRTAVIGGLMLFIGGPDSNALSDKFDKLLNVFES